MTGFLTLPPAVRRTGSSAAPGAQRLTFRTLPPEVDAGAVVALENGETFRVLERLTDPAKRPLLVVQPSEPASTLEGDEAMSAITEAPTDTPTLETVPVEIESSLVAPVNRGDITTSGKVPHRAHVAPEPVAFLLMAHQATGATPAETLVYERDSEAVAAIDALLAAHAEEHRKAANDVHALSPLAPLLVHPKMRQRPLSVVQRRPSEDGRRVLFVCRPAGANIGNEIAHRAQAARNATYANMNREHENAYAERSTIAERREQTRNALDTLARLKSTHPDEYAEALAALTGEPS